MTCPDGCTCHSTTPAAHCGTPDPGAVDPPSAAPVGRPAADG